MTHRTNGITLFWKSETSSNDGVKKKKKVRKPKSASMTAVWREFLANFQPHSITLYWNNWDVIFPAEKLEESSISHTRPKSKKKKKCVHSWFNYYRVFLSVFFFFSFGSVKWNNYVSRAIFFAPFCLLAMFKFHYRDVWSEFLQCFIIFKSHKISTGQMFDLHVGICPGVPLYSDSALIKKSLAQEVRQKSDISKHRSKGWG